MINLKLKAAVIERYGVLYRGAARARISASRLSGLISGRIELEDKDRAALSRILGSETVDEIFKETRTGGSNGSSNKQIVDGYTHRTRTTQRGD